MIYKEKQGFSSVSDVLDMVGVASSNLVAPTKFGRQIKHLAETPGAFFWPPRLLKVSRPLFEAAQSHR
jgi:hypothetical protein